MRGVILAGGKGTRMLPATRVMNKHLIPLLNKPMILYPLETLKRLGITDIMVISGGEHLGGIIELLGDGSEYGVDLTYRAQKEAGGIAQALSLAEGFVGFEGHFAVILGDNVFGSDLVVPLVKQLTSTLIVKEVEDPQRFGVFSDKSRRIVEKPKKPDSNLAVTGLYIYTWEVFSLIRRLKPSRRGELEITDLNNLLLDKLRCDVYETRSFWSDVGTPESMLRTIKYLNQ